MRGSRPWQGGSKGYPGPAIRPQLILPLGLGSAHLSLSGMVLTNLATGPLMGSFPVEKSQPLPADQSRIDQGKHLPHPQPLSLSQLCQHRTLCSWGPEAELALPPDRWMTSQRLTPTRHHDGPQGGLTLLLGPLPTRAPWLTSAGRQSTHRGRAPATRRVTLGQTEPQLSPA